MFSNTLKVSYEDKIDIGDIKLYCKVYGSSFDNKIDSNQETLIILHGGPGLDHTLYTRFWSELSTFGKQVIFIDQRGNGRSDYSDEKHWNLNQWSRDIASFCKAIELKKQPVLGGVSFGGFVAQKCAIEYPNLLAGVILTDSDAHVDFKAFLKRLKGKIQLVGARANEVINHAVEWFNNPSEEAFKNYVKYVVPYYQNNPKLPGDFDDIIQKMEVLKYFNQNELFTFDFRLELCKVKCPFLLITGDYSPFHSLESALETNKALPKRLVQFEVFKGAGTHVYDHYPEKVLGLMKNFMEEKVKFHNIGYDNISFCSEVNMLSSEKRKNSLTIKHTNHGT